MRNILVIVGLGLLLMVGVKRMTRQNIPVKFNNNPTVIGSKDDRNPFGVMFANAKYVSIAKDLGVKYYRPLSLSSSNWDGTCVECEAATNNGLGLILTVRNSDSSGLVANPPTDLESYKRTLGQIVDKYKPEVLVIENEENSALFYTGTPRQYHQQLRAGCEVAHSKGTKCTNGGLVSELVVLLVTDNMVQKGQISMANEFLQVSLGEKLKSQFGLVNADAGKLLALPKVAEMVSKGKLLMNGYKADGADYINFHWYVADAQSLATSVKYLEQASGLPAVTNEVGQQNSTDPVWVTTVMQKIVDLKLPVAVWFSVDTPGFGQAKSLIDSDGKLRSNGEAFGEFVRHL